MQGGGTTNSAAVLRASLPTLPILVPLAVHFLLVCFVLIYDWLPTAYMFVHLGLVLAGLASGLDRASPIPAIAFLVILLMSMLIDVILLGLYFDDADDGTDHAPSETRRNWQFSAAMCIINLLIKPMTLALSCIAIYARIAGDSLAEMFGARRENYSVIGGASEAQQSQ